MKYTLKKRTGYFFLHNKEVIYTAKSSKKGIYIKQLYKGESLIGESELKYKFPITIYHKITFKKNKKVIKLKYKNIFKPEYSCIYKNDKYSIYPHIGYDMSIFKNSKQIGLITQKKVEYMGGHNAVLSIDKSENIELIFLFILALICDFNTDYSNLNLGLGNIGFEAKKKDSQWTPN